ncbi:MAG: D-tyrosyl-tRNA(Tyr) deacylase [Methanolinea sp.]|nr:D-tyrosyl-tRNA(Tyr) deacylase [Methanolinea sp.]
MKIALVSSLQDPGGCTIHDALLALLGEPHGAYPLERHDLSHHRVKDRLIYQDHIDRDIDADLIIFLSRHSSKNPVPVLTVHVTGNFTTADFGGREGTLAPSAPAWMQAVLRELAKNAPSPFRVAYEVTHHGPTELSTPSLFAEVGSTEREWSDRAAGLAVARSVLSADHADCIPLIGFGGTHYAARQTHIALTTRGAFGHIAHSREVPSLDAGMVRQMREKSGAIAAFIDRKSLPSGELARLLEILAREDIPVVPEEHLVHMGRLSWDSYRKILFLAEGLSPGGRVVLCGDWPDGTPHVIDIFPGLLEEALRCNMAEFLKGTDVVPVARVSTPRIPVLSRFITIREQRDEVLHHLISLCVNILRKGESTFMEKDCLTIRRRVFDPEKARELGVPRGPCFGRLMKGETVLVAGREITPEMVTTVAERRIHIPGLEKFI